MTKSSPAVSPTAFVAAVLGVTLAFGIALAGHFVGRALFAARAADRFVTVKGLAEREVAADLALWPIVFTVTADDLESLHGRIEGSTSKVTDFLAGAFGPDQISVSTPEITDRQSSAAQGTVKLERYVAQTAVLLRSSDIEAVRRTMARSGDLVKQGVALIRSYNFKTRFDFTALDQVKPEMINEATRDARRAAEQFAEDSGSRVGAIRRAQQGYFSITDRDPFSPEVKRIRVVTTVEFFLVGD